MEDAYRAFTHRIGLLSPPEVSKVMFVYLTQRTYIGNLFLIGASPPTGDRHVAIPARNLPMFHQIREALIDPIKEAIDVLERARDEG